MDKRTGWLHAVAVTGMTAAPAGSDHVSASVRVRPLMRALLVIGTILVFAAGTQLYVLSAKTGTYFAWTIANPLTAATIGGFYYAAVVLAGLSARQRRWDLARVGVPGILVFLWLTICASLIHLEVLHLHGQALAPRIAAIAWLIIYAADPPLLLLAFALQVRASRRAGPDPIRTAPTAVWYRWACGVLAIPILGAGIGMYVFPGPGSRHWAWPLPPLAAQALAAWMIALGLLLATVAREGDLLRIRPASAGLVALALFELLALVRYPGAAHGAAAGAWLAAIAAVGFLGSYGLARSVWRSWAVQGG
jgi:hypothetical protein